MAGQHLSVRKEIRGDATYASVGALSEDGRAAELARMLSGDPMGEVALTHARVLLASRNDFPQGVQGAR
jgi:DNA repair ATPase RecN